MSIYISSVSFGIEENALIMQAVKHFLYSCYSLQRWRKRKPTDTHIFSGLLIACMLKIYQCYVSCQWSTLFSQIYWKGMCLVFFLFVRGKFIALNHCGICFIFKILENSLRTHFSSRGYTCRFISESKFFFV